MMTDSVNAKKSSQAEYYDLSGTDMEPPLELDSSASSSDGQNYSINHIHIEDYFNSIRDPTNESILKEVGAERRMQEITKNNTMMFKEELYTIHGGHEMHNVQQQQVITDLLLHIQNTLFYQKTKTVISARSCIATAFTSRCGVPAIKASTCIIFKQWPRIIS